MATPEKSVGRRACCATAARSCALRRRGDSSRSQVDDLWLTSILGVGSVYYFSSVRGEVWYTAHIVATVLTGLFVLAAFDARFPVLAGICLGAILLTRPHIAAWALFFAYEAWRATPASDGKSWRARIPWGKPQPVRRCQLSRWTRRGKGPFPRGQVLLESWPP